MSKCIWYISKYFASSTKGNVGGRGYLLMKKIASLGYMPIIITSDSNQLNEVPDINGKYLHELTDGIQMIWIRTMKYKVAKSIRRVFSWIDFEIKLLLMSKSKLPNPDAVIVSSLSLLSVFNGLILKNKYRCELIFEVRDIWPLTLTEEGGFTKHNPFVIVLSFVEYIGYKYSDKIVGTMPNLSEHVANILGYSKKTYCIPMGIDTDTLENQSEVSFDYLQKYIPNNKFIVVHAGTIGITNALDIFFKCAVEMSDKSHIHFLIVGDGDLREHYQSKYGHLPNLSFAPKVPKNMVQSILAHCDLLYFSVHQSKVWQYGQSLNKVIDYMLSGKPIVASYTGYPSMIDESGSGTFIPAGDVMALKDEIMRYSALNGEGYQKIGAAGREWLLENRSYELLAKQYLSIMFDK